MNPLKIYLLGRFRVFAGDKEVTSFRMHKVRALLIFLAAEPAQAQRRETLMTLLWPGMPEHSARANLRQVLFHLRRAIPDFAGENAAGEKQIIPLLIANRQTIQLNPRANIEIDTVQFDGFIAQTAVHDHIDLLSCRTCHQNLAAAIDHYTGDFLSDFYLDDSNEFEEWAEVTRQSCRRRALDALETLAAISTRQKAYNEARAYAERQLEIDNLRESAYRQLMQILALSGRRAEALSTYENYRRVLAEELGMAPSTRTTRLYENIQTGDLLFDLPPDQAVRGYELQEEIGHGAYGVIHRALQPAVGREVAVKIIRWRYANDPAFIRRFETEAQTIARLEHPHIVPLYDYWREPEGAYLVMRLLKGGNLLTALEQGPWAPERAQRLLDQIAPALDSAHRQGIVHRDIKPANILFDEGGNGYLSDFGIAADLTVEPRTSRDQLTFEAGIVGTPDYISPEQLQEGPVSPQSDIYSLGAVLYELLTGEKPFPDVPLLAVLQSHLSAPFPLVCSSMPNLPPQIDRVIQKATAKDPASRYPDMLQMAEAFRLAVHGRSPDPADAVAIERGADAGISNPYKGLRPFQEADALDFYGREALVSRLVKRLGRSRFTAVIGPSGSGKSSAVKAGLIPALRRGALPGSENWYIAEMVPGTHPLEELEMALWPIAVDPPPSLVEPMQIDSRGMLRTIRRILPDEEGAQLLLVIDQFEELFTMVADTSRRDHFLESLLATITAPRTPLRVIINLRADFYDRPLRYPNFGQLVRDNLETVLPLNAEELAEAIVLPAERAGVHLEPGLETTIVTTTLDQPGALPLMQYALTELFENRAGQRLTLAAYEALGGVTGALGGRADNLYADLEPGGCVAAQQLFIHLVELGQDGAVTRRRVPRAELESLAVESREERTETGQQDSLEEPPQIMAQVIDLFGRHRLLTFDRDPVTRAPTVEVAHEALFHEWGRLKTWLDSCRDDIYQRRRLELAAAEWAAADHDASFELRGSRLDQMAAWAKETSLALTPAAGAYLEAGLDRPPPAADGRVGPGCA